MGLGIVIGLLVSSYNLLKKSLQISKQNKEIKILQQSLAKPETASKEQIKEEIIKEDKGE